MTVAHVLVFAVFGIGIQGPWTRACFVLINVAKVLPTEVARLYSLVIPAYILIQWPDTQTAGFGYREPMCRQRSVAGLLLDYCSGGLVSPPISRSW